MPNSSNFVYTLHDLATQIKTSWPGHYDCDRIQLTPLNKQPKPNPDNHDHVFVNLGTFSGIDLDLYIVFDTNGSKWRFYAGIKKQGPRMRKFLNDIPQHMRPVTTFNGEAAMPLSRTGIPADYLGKVIQEQYGSWYWIGFYDLRDAEHDASLSLFVDDAIKFYSKLFGLRKIPHNDKLFESLILEDIYSAVENKKTVGLHIRRERDPKLAPKCKERDGYQCQICNFKFTDMYGDIGHEFAEAHHIVPLHTLDEGTLSTLDDVITVCANCHRMLHRMDGVPGDIERLKSFVAKNTQITPPPT